MAISGVLGARNEEQAGGDSMAGRFVDER